MSNKVVIIGSGGREHSLAWKLAQSSLIKHIYVAPGNGGTEKFCSHKVSNLALNIKDHAAIVLWCSTNNVKLVVVGPEDPLANGLADDLETAGIACFGPKKKAAQIESDKAFAKAFMQRHDIPTARWKTFTDPSTAKEHVKNTSYPALVVKASGLAAGKGVIVATNTDEAIDAVDLIMQNKAFGDAGSTIVIEELLEGEEVSVLAFTDGNNIAVMPAAQDHKRAYEGDRGPNTGGMGAYCPCPLVKEDDLKIIRRDVIQKAVDGLRQEGMPYVGVLYAGLMLTKDGPRVLEYNCRFGDPETECILPLLTSDLYTILVACVTKKLAQTPPVWKEGSFSVAVVLASEGYPGSYATGKVVKGLKSPDTSDDVIVFHAGTAQQGDKILTSGGRVLVAVALESSLESAVDRVQKTVNEIRFEGSFFRKDIGYKALNRSPLTYKSCGVDIESGEVLVSKIKEFAKSTHRPGVASRIGGFGGVFDLRKSGYKDPLLLSGTDGVGTKLKIAHACSTHDTVGIDLVAMCVNDILTQGAEPLFFLDYFACSHLDVAVAANVVNGIARGCKRANCALIGGETAEMPGMYANGEYDLAGFAVGAVERTNLLPALDAISEGDILIGISSSGVHSNGFSLVRKLMEREGLKYSDPASFSPGQTLGEALMTPTKIYVKSVLPAMQKGLVKAAAHITGGGLMENIPRVLPKEMGVVMDADKWRVCSVFSWIASAGAMSEDELCRTFNCGLGLVLIVDKRDCVEVKEVLRENGEQGLEVGFVQRIKEGEKQVRIENFSKALGFAAELKPKKRVAVLISGSGTNLQALINHTHSASNASAAEIVLVISNVPGVEGLQRATRAKIPSKVINHKEYKSRMEFDMAVHKELLAAKVDFICLAGFMRIVSEEFVNLWRGKMLNIHPSLLPAFPGVNSHRQVLEAGARITGATVHFVEVKVDSGGIINQAAVPVEVGDTEETLQQRVHRVEYRIYPEAMELLAQDKVRLGENGKVIWNCL